MTSWLGIFGAPIDSLHDVTRKSRVGQREFIKAVLYEYFFSFFKRVSLDEDVDLNPLENWFQKRKIMLFDC